MKTILLWVWRVLLPAIGLLLIPLGLLGGAAAMVGEDSTPIPTSVIVVGIVLFALCICLGTLIFIGTKGKEGNLLKILAEEIGF